MVTFRRPSTRLWGTSRPSWRPPLIKSPQKIHKISRIMLDHFKCSGLVPIHDVFVNGFCVCTASVYFCSLFFFGSSFPNIHLQHQFLHKNKQTIQQSYRFVKKRILFFPKKKKATTISRRQRLRLLLRRCHPQKVEPSV